MVLEINPLDGNDFATQADFDNFVKSQGFDFIDPRKIHVKDSEKSEYYVYSDSNDYKAVEADTVVKALEGSEIAKPYKIFHAHCRLDDIIAKEKLEPIELNANVEEEAIDQAPVAESQTPAENNDEQAES